MSERLAGPIAEAAPRAGVRLQTRGVVQPGALYIARRVDEALVAALAAGRWAVVLGPRFSGKSSLRVRTARTLQAAPGGAALGADTLPVTHRCVTIEARSLPAAASGAIYLALCSAIATELRLSAASAFWQRHSDEPPAVRLRNYLLHEVVTAQTSTVILIDDLDALQLLPIDLPELLGALGQVREALGTAGAAGRLTLAFFSTVTPEQLAVAPAGQTLWAAERFLLPDFTRPELSAFGPALATLVRGGEPALVQHFIDAVFDWTAGHPQLTQHLCQQLVARAPSAGGSASGGGNDGLSDPTERVERLVRLLFLDQEDVIEQDPCLREMAQALTRSAPALIALYRRLLSGVPVTPDPLDAVQRELRLGGLATAADDLAGTPRLRPRCRLVATVLGDSWARELEVRLILQEATAGEAATDERAAAGKLLRGVPLKTAQAWARKNPAALRPPEVRVLVASLEAARSEAEARHQASAATLQRERRDKTELRYPHGPASAPALSSNGSSDRSPWWRLSVAAAIGLLLCSAVVAWASAHRRALRFEQASQEATARAVRAEQALRALQSDRTATGTSPAQATGTSLGHGIVTSAGAGSRGVDGIATAAAPTHTTIPPRDFAARHAALPALTRTAAGSRKLAGAGHPAERKTPVYNGSPARHAAAREVGSCPDPARPAD